jgi:hypothetical protein
MALHPSVESIIVDNSFVFVSGQGTLMLFAAITSDQGPDNVATLATSVSEYHFHWGQPNIKKHGQAGINIDRWLTAGGSALILRVMPDNAGYAHSIFSIQTKVETKKVLHSNGTLIDIPNVTLRHTNYTTPINNKTVDGLRSELTRETPDTVDGFKNHKLFAIYPKGRGKSYNNLGMKISLNEAYDNTYDFRVYDVYITKTMADGSVLTVDGPFPVSFSPDAVSRSNESMFIEYVINKYSVYANVIFNEKAFDELGEIINPYINPSKIDFLTGITREVANSKQTFFYPETNKDEDEHLFLIEYDSNGVSLGTLNIVDATDSIESAIVGIDNTSRNNTLLNNSNMINDMKTVLSKVRANAFDAYADSLATLNVDAIEGSIKETNDAIEEAVTGSRAIFNTALANYDSEPNSDNADALNTAAKKLSADVLNHVNACKTILNTSRAFGDNNDNLQLNTRITNIENKDKVFNVNLTKSLSYASKLSNMASSLELANTSSNNALKISTISEALTLGNESLNFVKTLEEVDKNYADTAIADADTALETALSQYSIATDKNTLPADLPTAINLALSNTITFIDKVSESLNLAMLEDRVVYTKTISDICTKVNFADVCVDLMTSAKTAAALDTAQTTIATAISSSEAAYNSVLQNTYSLFLQDFNTPVKFNGGTDGDLDESNPSLRATTTKNLLINAYTGIIDPSIADKRQWQFDVLLDSNLPVEVKNAMVTLASQIRQDCVFLADTGFTANPQQAIDFRVNQFPVSTFYTSIFSQDFVVYDQYSGMDCKVTAPYFLSDKVPTVHRDFGRHFPIAGTRRGMISGHKSMSWNPSEAWKEQLYKRQINYFFKDPRRGTQLDSQLTSQMQTSALSNLNNIFTLLKIRRDVEFMAEDYKFEFTGSYSTFQSELNGYLANYITSGACKSISGIVYASDYDKQNKLVRVRINLSFTDIIERVAIEIVVNK